MKYMVDIDGTICHTENRDYENSRPIQDRIDKMKETFAGREELRERGWVIDEVEPELIEQAKWLEEERQLKYLELEKQYEMMSYDEERV